MKKLLLAALAVLTLAGLAAAGTSDITTMADGTCYNIATHQRVDCTTGAVLTVEHPTNLDRNNWIVYQNAINDTISNGALVGTAWAASAAAYSFCAESTIVIPCAQYRRFALAIQVKPPGGDTTTAVVRFAVQVRGHTANVADSANTFAWNGWSAGTANMADSMGAGLTAQAGNGALPLNNEKVIDIDPRRGIAGTFGQMFGWPNGIMLDLVDTKSQPFWFPYISIRVRQIGGGSGKSRIIVHLAMGS